MPEPTVLKRAIVAILDEMDPAVTSFANRAPQDARAEYVIFRGIDANSDEYDHLQGPAGIVDARIQFDAYSESEDAAEILAGRVRQQLLSYYLGGTIAGVVIRSVRRLTKIDARDDLSDPKLKVVTQDFRITHNEI